MKTSKYRSRPICSLSDLLGPKGHASETRPVTATNPRYRDLIIYETSESESESESESDRRPYDRIAIASESSTFRSFVAVTRCHPSSDARRMTCCCCCCCCCCDDVPVAGAA